MVWALSLSTMNLITHRLTPIDQVRGIRSLIGFGNHDWPLDHSVLYPRDSSIRLALKLFRREPAISELDWNFTAIHSSSDDFSTSGGSGLHEILLSLHPVHG